MPDASQFQPTWGTALATFTQTGTYSAPIQLNRQLVGLYSDNYPAAAGSIVIRASASPTGTGYPVQTSDGTVLKVLAVGSGTFYSFNTLNAPVPVLPFVVLQVGTAGTAGVAGGGTIVLVTGP